MNTESIHNHKPTQKGRLVKGCVACNMEKNKRLAARLMNDTGVCSSCGDSECFNLSCFSAKAPDMVNHLPHYTSHPSGVECIQVTEHMSFCIGNAVKYLWRADEKGSALEDLEKARWYITREIERRKGMKKSS